MARPLEKPPTRKTSRSKSIVERKRDGRLLKRTTVYLPLELARQVVVYCAQNEVDMSELISDLLTRKMSK